MTGSDFLHTTQREKLEALIKNQCCPSDLNIETEYSANIERCNDYCQGDCEECWNSKIVDL